MVGASLSSARPITYCTELATDEKTLLAFEPTNRMVPTTMTRITANITAYSAISWASSPTRAFQRTLTIFHLPWGTRERLAIQERWGTAGKTLTRSRAKWLASTPFAPPIVHSSYQLVTLSHASMLVAHDMSA